MEQVKNDWERRFCRNQRCTVDTLLVKQWPSGAPIWWVARNESDAPWTEAATVPVCPLCGETLKRAAATEEAESKQEGVVLGGGGYISPLEYDELVLNTRVSPPPIGE